ncbi:3-carboxy-cis,cis-muconate cycloisomerase [uncultured Sneathiella sp.]|uniref:3-carboxy-cis,cis-muconate cycloisomerase n=1 Tax=uncultured Sneathiella sp. TaxID=879315 RepID=UPI0030D89CC1|tara:strand:- start:1312 stop:2370 length:1059 start_codon:yes stop_codon:yes gene_type:complete
MTVSAFEHPFLAGIAGRDEITDHLGAEAEIRAMLAFETALARATADAGLIPDGSALEIETAASAYQPDWARLREGVMRDGVVVPELVSALKETVNEETRPAVHYGATSQDVIDTALVLRLRPILDLFRADIEGLLVLLRDLTERFGQDEVMGRTRLQDALPILFHHRLGNWRSPLSGLLRDLEGVEKLLLKIQFGGAVGTLDRFDGKGKIIRAKLAQQLSLADTECWHTDRRSLGAFASWMSSVTAALSKIGTDIALMKQNGLDEIRLSSAGGSSAMAHKKNPVQAEYLMSFARFTAGQAGIFSQSAVHEFERSGSSLTLEWLVLPQMIQATGASLSHGKALLGSITGVGAR